MTEGFEELLRERREHAERTRRLPGRLAAAVPAGRPPAPRATAPAASPTLASEPAAPEAATAAWMLTTYGRAEAETRAQAALAFYDAESADGRYWRRVLARIVTAR